MASALIHIAIAKKVEEKLNKKIKRKYDYYLGSIAPDLSKQIGESKEKAHFSDKSFEKDIPNIDLFIKKYHDFKNNSFDLGYFTHLYTDKMWKENLLPTIKQNNTITLLDGTSLETASEEIENIIYSDYTNLNIQLIDEYNIDLSLFYEEFKRPKTNIQEIDIDKLDILINKMGIIIENSKESKTYLFDLKLIKKFIDTTSEQIIKELN